MASNVHKRNSAPMQPGLRSFIVYDEVPIGCSTFMLVDNHGEPHFWMGELAIIDETHRAPIEGELALVQMTPARPSEAHLHRYVMEVREQWGGWMVAAVKPQRPMAVAGDDPRPEEIIRFWDGPYPTDYITNMIIGQVVGILEPKISEPRRSIAVC